MNTNEIRIPDEFLAAPKEQQMDYIQRLLEIVAPDGDSEHKSHAHEPETRERLSALHAGSLAGKSLDDVRDELLDKFHKESLNVKSGSLHQH